MLNCSDWTILLYSIVADSAPQSMMGWGAVCSTGITSKQPYQVHLIKISLKYLNEWPCYDVKGGDDVFPQDIIFGAKGSIHGMVYARVVSTPYTNYNQQKQLFSAVTGSDGVKWFT